MATDTITNVMAINNYYYYFSIIIFFMTLLIFIIIFYRENWQKLLIKMLECNGWHKITQQKKVRPVVEES